MKQPKLDIRELIRSNSAPPLGFITFCALLKEVRNALGTEMGTQDGIIPASLVQDAKGQSGQKPIVDKAVDRQSQIPSNLTRPRGPYLFPN